MCRGRLNASSVSGAGRKGLISLSSTQENHLPTVLHILRGELSTGLHGWGGGVGRQKKFSASVLSVGSKDRGVAEIFFYSWKPSSIEVKSLIPRMRESRFSAEPAPRSFRKVDLSPTRPTWS